MTPRIYEEVVKLIASGPTSQQIVSFTPSEEAKARFWDLIDREKNEQISAEEKGELDHYMHVEHIMRLAKARARVRLHAKQ